MNTLTIPDFKLSDYMWWKEMVGTSQTDLALNNEIQAIPYIPVMVDFLRDSIDPIREYLGYPLPATSGFRCSALNARIGGSLNSNHMRGLAVDIHRPEWTWQSLHWDVGPKIVKAVYGLDLKIKVILERRSADAGTIIWIHVSKAPEFIYMAGDNGVYTRLEHDRPNGIN